jgi:tRNA (guanine37-N1)-methyltransferase
MPAFTFDVLTIFPEMVSHAVRYSLLGKAIESGIIEVRVHDIRDFASDKHKSVDDEPFGGGPGMVMKVVPIVSCLRHVRTIAGEGTRAYLLSASGKPFDQRMARQIAEKEKGIILVCGHYEGVDERVAQHYVDDELSVGDYVLGGGEVAALVVIEAASRLLPGVLGNYASTHRESFEDDLLEYPQFTRPRVFEGHAVPEVLVSGNHAGIEKFRRQIAIEKTKRNRPDLYQKFLAKKGGTDEQK